MRIPENISLIASAVFAIGIIVGCDYCLPALLATIAVTVINRTMSYGRDELIELLSHSAH